jgi:ribonucleoside-diphosphate reductase alpha chain
MSVITKNTEKCIIDDIFDELNIPEITQLERTKSYSTIEYEEIYKNIIQKFDKNIKPTEEYVKIFLQNIISTIILKTNEKKPEIIDIDFLSKDISRSLPVSITLNEFYNYVAELMMSKSVQHYYFNYIATYISIKRIHNITPKSFLTTVKLLQCNIDKNGDNSPIYADDVFNIILENSEKIENAIVSDRDYDFDFFGIKTLERAYLYKLFFTKFKIIERPQYMIMRVALGIHKTDITAAIETYNLISQRYFTHATPTLFNSGTRRPQMSSCFLLSIDDSLKSIMKGNVEKGYISKNAGGIGVAISALRAKGSLIRGTNGPASGVIPYCCWLNKEAKYINQGGKRNGSIAVYLEPWHPDIFDFCNLRKNDGNDDNRARDLFLALWTPSLFIERVKEDSYWSLMCPDECPGLNTVHSEEFNELYLKYENKKMYRKQVKAREVWLHILEAQAETGFPYVLFKDNANKKSNQRNLGTIRCSNLCSEIIEYSDDNETAVCNLSSLCLPMFVKKNIENNKPYFDHQKLIDVCRVNVRNLNKIIDVNYYPTGRTKYSNLKHRPIGIGVQGLADTYQKMSYAFDSKEAILLNKQIFETIYFACIDESKELAKKDGHYSSFKNSPFSEGKLQFHLWDKSEDELLMGYDWKTLIEEVKKYGTRNSLITALMPTASTSQIMGNSECIEPYSSNIFKRSTIAGEFVVVNKNLMKDLIKLDLWSEDMRKRIIIDGGSVQNIDSIPDEIKDIYKTAFELKQNQLVQQSADRGIFIDQSQSFNLFFDKPNFNILGSALIMGHDLGSKTGLYYYRTKPAVDAIKFGVDINDIKRLTNNENIMDMITDTYKIDNNNETNNKKKPLVCKWKPGMKREECLVCSA